MVWKEKYRIGIGLVDAQHEELFDRVTRFLDAMQEKADFSQKLPEIRRTMDFMQNYVVVHFDAEEAYQEQIGYPQRAAHHKTHEDFKAYVTRCAQDFETQGFTDAGVKQFAGKLLAWLVNHVVCDDQKIAAFAAAAGGIEG